MELPPGALLPLCLLLQPCLCENGLTLPILNNFGGREREISALELPRETLPLGAEARWVTPLRWSTRGRGVWGPGHRLPGAEHFWGHLRLPLTLTALLTLIVLLTLTALLTKTALHLMP